MKQVLIFLLSSLSAMAQVAIKPTLTQTDQLIPSVLKGVGVLTWANPGTLVLTGANTYTGTTTINSGSVLQLGNGGTTGSLGTGPIANNGTLIVNRSAAYTLGAGNLMSGTGSFVVNGSTTSGVTIPSMANTYTGGTTVNGFLAIQMTTPYNYSPVGTGAVTVNPGATLQLQRTLVTAAGTLPTINLNGGTLSQATYGTAGSNYYDPINLNANSTITSTGTGAGLSLYAPISLGSNTLTVYPNGGSISMLNPAVLSGTGNVIYNGNGIQVVSTNAVNTYTGTTTINSGAIVQVNGGSQPFGPTSAAGVTVNTGGEIRTLGFNLSNNPTTYLNGGVINSISSSFYSNPVVLTANSTIRNTGSTGYLAFQTNGTVDIGPYDLTLDNRATTQYIQLNKPVSGSGNIIVANTSTYPILLGAANTLSGTVTVNAGGIVINAGTFNPFGTASVTFNSGTTLNLNSSRDTGYAGIITLNNATITNGANSFARWQGTQSFVLASGTNTFSTGGNGQLSIGNLSGPGNLVIANTNPGVSVSINGTNTNTGTTSITSGWLQISNPLSLYNANTALWTTNLTVASGASLWITFGGTGAFTSAQVDALKSLGSATGGFQTGSTLAINATGTQTYPSNITSTDFGGNVVNLRKTNAGTLILTGTNSYPGTTTIDATGVLQIGSNTTTGTLGTGDVINNGTLAFNRSNNLTVTNNISGTGALTKQGAGTLTLTGLNSYSGTTSFSAGTLQISGASSLGTGNVTVNSGGTLTYTVDTSGTRTVTVNTGGVVNKGGFAHTGTTFVNNGGTINP